MSLAFPEDLLGGTLYAVGEYVRSQNFRCSPKILSSYRWLTIMSEVGHETDCDETELDLDDLIDTAQTAALLGYSERHVRRIQADLGGARPGHGLVFSRRQVVEYLNARKEGHQ